MGESKAAKECAKQNGKSTPTEESDIVKLLKKQRESGRYCDVTIKVANKSFQAHKNVLAAFSSYFASRISEDPANSVLVIDWTTPEIFEVILDYVYTNNIVGANIINNDNAECILRAISFVKPKVCPLSKACAQHLGKTLKEQNLIKLYDLATEVSCEDLVEMLNKFVRKNFSHICQSSAFLALKPEHLIEIIKDDDLFVGEEIIFDSVLRWIKHDKDRELMLPKVLFYIRLAVLSPEFLTARVKEEEIIKMSATCLMWVLDVITFKFQPQLTEPLPNFRKPRSAAISNLHPGKAKVPEVPEVPEVPVRRLVTIPNAGPRNLEAILVLGRTEENVRTMVAINFDNGRRSNIPIPDILPEEGKIVCAVDGNLVYVAVIGDITLCSFDMTFYDWKEVFYHNRAFTALSCLNGELYSNSSHGCSSLSAVAVYDEAQEHWISVSHRMPALRLDCSLVAYQDKIYAIGGHLFKCPRIYSNSLQCYEPLIDTWTELPCGTYGFSRRKVRKGISQKLLCCAFRGKIFVIDATPETKVSATEVHVFNINEAEWETPMSLHKAYTKPSALLVLNDRLTFIDASLFPRLNVERFSQCTNSWEVNYVRDTVGRNMLNTDFHIFSEAVKIPFC